MAATAAAVLVLALAHVAAMAAQAVPAAQEYK
jgi:hypothetical protein